ncbi:MAG TPA: hypothetical protein VK943_01985 [Arenibaculum sp.]|nr:hypothetical protein [Arenibaculum sp.]
MTPFGPKTSRYRRAAVTAAAFAAFLSMAVLAAVLALGAGAGVLAAGMVTTGEALLGRDVEVRSAPDPAAAIVLRLPRGTVVMALGSARGSAFNEIAIGGRSTGFVPNDALTSIYGPREIAGRVAVVARSRWAADGILRGSHVVTRTVTGIEQRDGKPHRTKVERGTVLSLLGVRDGKPHLASDTITGISLPADALLPIIGVHDYPVSTTGTTFHIARMDERPDPAEARALWHDLTLSLPQLAGYTPFIYPSISQSLRFSLAFGPLDRSGADAACAALSQSMIDCWVVEVVAL